MAHPGKIDRIKKYRKTIEAEIKNHCLEII